MKKHSPTRNKYIILLFIQNIFPIGTHIIHHNQLLMTKFGRVIENKGDEFRRKKNMEI